MNRVMESANLLISWPLEQISGLVKCPSDEASGETIGGTLAGRHPAVVWP